MSKEIPLLKEYRLSKLKKCLECIDQNPFNREKQRNCVLALYPSNPKGLDHMEKSIFRGMVIPSLRHLGLIIGFGDLIKLSANGKLIIESDKISSKTHSSVLRTIIYEIDSDIFQFLEFINKTKSVNVVEFFDSMISLVEGISDKQRKERISKWLSVLEQVELVIIKDGRITINKEILNETLFESEQILKNTELFLDYFLDAYYELSKDSAGIVDIRTYRERVALKILVDKKTILTEKKFDIMLRKLPRETKKYTISFGRPMGAKEKLFESNDNYFGTILIQFHRVKDRSR